MSAKTIRIPQIQDAQMSFEEVLGRLARVKNNNLFIQNNDDCINDSHIDNFNGIKKMLAKSIGEPYYSDKNCVLYCVDTLEVQSKIQAAFANVIVTSPPYNIGKEYESIKPINEYVEWSAKWINESANLLNTGGSLLLNVGYVAIDGIARAIPIPYLLWDKISLYLNQEIVWNYSAGVACKHYLSPRNEKILWYVKDKDSYTFNLDAIRDPNVKYPNSKKNGKLRTNTLGKNPSDVWEIAKVTTGMGRSSTERTSHPCQFPLDLVNRMILGFSSIGDVIYDPFLGSGTTFESCIKNKRFGVGFEIRKDYCNVIVNRIKNLYDFGF
jgi:adenine-specific DNA-methyltransferase